MEAPVETVNKRTEVTGSIFGEIECMISAAVGGSFGNDVDISGYRVYYRGTDGTGLDAQITVRLYRWTMAGLFQSAGASFNSNSFAPTGDITVIHNVVHDVDWDALYSFRVTLRRNNTNQHPRFHGIDFLTFGPPPG